MVSEHMRSTFGAGVAATALLAALLVTGAPVHGADKRDKPGKAKEPSGSRIYGKVRGSDGKTALRDVRVHAYHLDTGQLYSSPPSKSNGEYEIRGLPYGYFELIVETAEGPFVSAQVVTVPPSSKALVLLTLKTYEELPDSWWSSHERREPPGTLGDRARGVAQVLRKRRGAEFWRSPKGVAILAGSGAAVLLAIAASDEERASPFLP